MQAKRFEAPTRPEARQTDPLPGDDWQGAALNELVPLLERNGYAIVAGSVDHGGLSVEKGGARCRIELVRPGLLRVHAEDDDRPLSDQWPMFPQQTDRND